MAQEISIRRPQGIPAFLPVTFQPIPPQPLSQRQDIFTSLHLKPLYDAYIRPPPEREPTVKSEPGDGIGSRPPSSHGRKRSGNTANLDFGMTSTTIAGPSRQLERRRSDAAIKPVPNTGPGPASGLDAPPSPSGSLDGNGKAKIRVVKKRVRKFGRYWDDLLQDTIDVKLEDRRPTLQAILHRNYPPHLDDPSFRFDPIGRSVDGNGLGGNEGLRLGIGKAQGVGGEYMVVSDRRTGKEIVVKSGAMTANQRRKARNKANAQARQTAPPALSGSGATSPVQTPFPTADRDRSNSMGGNWSPGGAGGAGGGEYFSYSPGYGGGSPVGSPRGNGGTPMGGRTPTYGGVTPR